MFLALELETDGAADADLAAHVVEYARNHGLLMGRTGRNRNILKLRPPMPFSNENVAMACDILTGCLQNMIDLPAISRQMGRKWADTADRREGKRSL